MIYHFIVKLINCRYFVPPPFPQSTKDLELIEFVFQICVCVVWFSVNWQSALWSLWLCCSVHMPVLIGDDLGLSSLTMILLPRHNVPKILSSSQAHMIL